MKDQPATSDLHARMGELARLSRELLLVLVDVSSGLFPHKAVLTATGIQPVGMNALYSAMSVVGLHIDGLAESSTIALPLEKTLDALSELTIGKRSPAGLLAATVWALGTARDPRARDALETLERGFVARTNSSADLGLVLASLATVRDVLPGSLDKVERLSAETTDELLHRFSESAQLFRGAAHAVRPRRLIDWNMTSFASQVYPIHGLAQYARATGTDPPEQVLRAADRLVEMQGPLGQWWWIYSSRTGSVVEPYPVYSVHQDAMAFMALAPLQNLGLRSYEAELARGLAWLVGENELNRSLVDYERSFISRCVQRRGADADGVWGMSSAQRRHATAVSWRLRRPPTGAVEATELEILMETRPYHLGWVLYARSLISDW